MRAGVQDREGTAIDEFAGEKMMFPGDQLFTDDGECGILRGGEEQRHEA